MTVLSFSLAHGAAGNHLSQSPLVKNNIKEYSTLKSIFGRIDEKTGTSRYRYNLYEPNYSGSAENIARSYLKDLFKEYGIDALTNTLKTVRVSQNFPTPFNPTTTIQYQIPKNTRVKLTIYAMDGTCVRTFEPGIRSPGYYSIDWDARNQSGDRVASGIYIYRFEAGSFRQVKK